MVGVPVGPSQGSGLPPEIMEMLQRAPQGMPGASMLNQPVGPSIMSLLTQAGSPSNVSGVGETLSRPAGPDIMSLIQMLLGGGGAQAPLPPLDQGAMMGQLSAGAPPMAGAMQPAAMPPAAAKSAPRKPRPEREDESRAGKMGIKTQKGKPKKNPPKGRSSVQERFARDMKD